MLKLKEIDMSTPAMYLPIGVGELAGGVGVVALVSQRNAGYDAVTSHIEKLQADEQSLQRTQQLLGRSDIPLKGAGVESVSQVLAETKKEIGTAQHNLPSEISIGEEMGLVLGGAVSGALIFTLAAAKIQRMRRARKNNSQAKPA